MSVITIDISYNNTLPQINCVQQMLYLIQMNPFKQTYRHLKSFTQWKHPIQPGQYRISLQYIAKEHNIDVSVSLNNTKLTQNLTFNKFLYFEVTEQFQIKHGNRQLFDKLFMERRINNNKSKIEFWNMYWRWLHTVTYHLPENLTQSHKDDILKLVDIMKTNGISCQRCINHFRGYIKDHPIEDYVEKQKLLFTYFVTLHNDVNRRNNKLIFSLADANKLYKTAAPLLEKDFKTSIKELIDSHKIHTLPSLINGPFNKIIKKKYNLIQ